MTKRTYTKSQGDSSTSLMLEAAKKHQSIPICGDNEELLAWERIDAKGLFELYRVNTGGPYFVRRSSDQSVKEYPVKPGRAEAIVRRIKRTRTKQIANESLKNGYSATFDGNDYDTRLDEVVYVGVGNETDAAAIHRTRSGEYYVHHIEKGIDEILTVNADDVHEMEAAIDFKFDPKQSFIQFLNWLNL